MKNKVLVTFSGLILLTYGGWSQSNEWVDTLESGALSHMYLNIEMPQGELSFKASDMCGVSISRLSSSDSETKQQIQTQTNEYGNHQRTVVVRSSEPNSQAKAAVASDNLRMAKELSDINFFSGFRPLQSEYKQDPSMSTDLYLNLGTGVSALDLSGLSLRNVSVNSAFSDVQVSYTDSNLVRMKEMDIHTAKANISVDHAELANAELITIQNDMGELDFVLGDMKPAHSTIYLQLGVGSCTLILSEKQPVHLVIKSGLFSTVDVSEESFEEQENGVYVNQAYKVLKDKKQANKIICNIDMGSVIVTGKK